MRAVRFAVTEHLRDSKEYLAVKCELGDRCAVRSGVPYMNHVDEGLFVLAEEGADSATMRAFALHPLFQLDDDLARSIGRVADLTEDPRVLVLTMEYRNIANAYLSRRVVSCAADVDLGPLPEVTWMLRADKIQNYKDFLLHHRDTHPRRGELHRYFRTWLERLDVPIARFADWFERLQAGPDRVPAAAVLELR